jgi:hypothetical protein
MKIVYIQDKDEKAINSDKLKILSMFGDEIFIPKVYYYEKNMIHGLYNELSGGNDLNYLLVGDYFGGYAAFYISNLMQCPALVFNPTFFYKNGGELKSEFTGQCHHKKIILSAKHPILDTKRTFKYLKEVGYDNKIKVFEHETPEIPMEIYRGVFGDFYEMYKGYVNPNYDRKSKPKYGSSSTSGAGNAGNDDIFRNDPPRPERVVEPRVRNEEENARLDDEINRLLDEDNVDEFDNPVAEPRVENRLNDEIYTRFGQNVEQATNAIIREEIQEQVNDVPQNIANL